MAGKQLIGDGGSMQASAGLLAGRMGIKDTESAADGTFTIAGVGPRALVLAADHPKEGRSRMVSIAPGPDSAQVDLVLEPMAALEGKVTRGGKPAASTLVMANPQSAVRGSFIVTAGSDGTYRFDRLTPDSYLVSALKVAGGRGSSDLHTRTVVLESGKTVKLDIALPPEGVKVTVTIQPAPSTAQVFLFSGRVQVTNAAQFMEAFAERGDGSLTSTITTKDKPAVFPDVQPGDYTLCVVPIPGDLNDPATMARLQEEADDLPIFCEPRVVKPSPPEQSLTITLKK